MIIFDADIASEPPQREPDARMAASLAAKAISEGVANPTSIRRGIPVGSVSRATSQVSLG